MDLREKMDKSANKDEVITNFIQDIIVEDLKKNKNDGRVLTRFPPEPNGYLHIGHSKTICLNFGIAKEYSTNCHLRFDDTNPSKESEEYVESIKTDVKWLGFDWGEYLFHASDYFDRLYDFAVQLIKKEKAYVCDLSPDEIREYRGTLTEPGKNSPYRNRSIQENLDLFERMRAGEFKDGEKLLRAKIDMASPNMNMRDPAVYRIKHVSHQRTGDKWCIYPMYDFTHCLSDSIERITHSLCTLEFEDHRPLYDWFLDQLEVECHPQQIEFSRLSLDFTVMSKRKLLELVEGKYVNGWDDPRMPTLKGLRRRGYTPDSIRDFCSRIGITKKENRIEVGLLENCIREDLETNTKRVLAVLRPIKVVIDNYPEGQVEELEAPYHPNDPEMGSRKIKFAKTLYIERQDFLEDPPKKFFRLGPGREVRLRYAYFIKCVDVVKDPKTGEVIEIHCTYDPASKGGKSPDGRKVKGTLHWVSAEHSFEVEIRLYDRLFLLANPEESKDNKEGKDYKEFINPNSLEVFKSSRIEASLKDAEAGSRYQFERQGYFNVDPVDSTSEKLVFNRIVTLRDTWAKIQNKK